jgi:hypothetical protein
VRCGVAVTWLTGRLTLLDWRWADPSLGGAPRVARNRGGGVAQVGCAWEARKRRGGSSQYGRWQLKGASCHWGAAVPCGTLDDAYASVEP